MSDLNRKAIEVKQKNEASWMKLEGVAAVGIGLHAGRPAIIVSVKKESDVIRNQLPDVIEGVPVIIKVTGDISAF